LLHRAGRWDQTTGRDHSGSLKLTPRSQVLAIPMLIATVAAGAAEPIAPGAIDVIDGDTIRAHGRSVRLVGFDAPESGLRARCESERALAAKATFRLRQLVSAGGLDLEFIPCSCRPGTEGTPRSNYGRACGILTAAGKDVGEILISEGLARRYVCGRTSCPRREPWCP
jgi:endonuclease YncB( thermonuclease family)